MAVRFILVSWMLLSCLSPLLQQGKLIWKYLLLKNVLVFSFQGQFLSELQEFKKSYFCFYFLTLIIVIQANKTDGKTFYKALHLLIFNTLLLALKCSCILLGSYHLVGQILFRLSYSYFRSYKHVHSTKVNNKRNKEKLFFNIQEKVSWYL